jgi:hypothetical protein
MPHGIKSLNIAAYGTDQYFYSQFYHLVDLHDGNPHLKLQPSFVTAQAKKKTETVPCPFMSLFLVRASCLLQDKLQDKAKQDNPTEKSCCSLQTDNFSSENIPI